MIDRVEALGGTLEVRSERGAGTTVLGRVPARTAAPVR
jgi:signal transduction histidine kinase